MWIRQRVETYCGSDFDQLIVTWYPPGAGIGNNTDDDLFGEPIAGLSLGSACAFSRVVYEKVGNSKRLIERLDQPVLARSLYVLRGRERWGWQHEIFGPKIRADRCSFTFRVLTEEARRRLDDC